MKRLLRGSVGALLTVVAVVSVHAAETPGCEEICSGASLPGCTYQDCANGTEGCVICNLECQTSCQLLVCPERDPALSCE